MPDYNGGGVPLIGSHLRGHADCRPGLLLYAFCLLPVFSKNVCRHFSSGQSFTKVDSGCVSANSVLEHWDEPRVAFCCKYAAY